MALHNLLTQLKRDEGLRLSAYLDTEGILTIGYGHNCQASPVPSVRHPGDAISQELADELLAEDTEIAIRETIAAFPWVKELSESRQAVFFNMAFNLGIPRLRGFKKFLHAAEIGDWNWAAEEMLDSRWAKQVKGRAVRLSKQMETGIWQ